MAHEADWLSPKPEGRSAVPVLGTMNFGKRTPESEAARIMHAALERGVDWFDTANAYNGGESERIIGRFLKANRKRVRVATKCGIGNMNGPAEGLAPEAIRAALDASLARLQLEQIDLYYLHTPDRSTPILETVRVLEEARVAGKIAHWGVSNFASWRIARIDAVCAAHTWPKPRVSQVLYNLLVRQLDVEYFDYARDEGIHTTVYNPLAGGLLAGKGLETVKPGSRFDRNARYQARYLSPRMREHAKACLALANEAGMDPVRLAYAWVAQQRGVDSVLLGPATVEQLEQGIAGCMHSLEPQLASKIEALHRDFIGTDASYAR